MKPKPPWQELVVAPATRFAAIGLASSVLYLLLGGRIWPATLFGTAWVLLVLGTFTQVRCRPRSREPDFLMVAGHATIADSADKPSLFAR